MKNDTVINLTIIIPHYNSAKLLIKLLNSIPQKENVQVIVVDDKSDDVELEILTQFYSNKNYKFELYQNTTNKKGAGTSRNIGLEKVKGKWVLFADSDDYFSNNFYESVTKYFNSDNDVVFFPPTSVFRDTGELAERHERIVNRQKSYQQKRDLKSELDLRYRLDVPTSKMIQREFLQNFKITFEEVLVSNDILFSAKVGFYMKKFEIAKDVIYVITRGSGTLTTNKSEYFFDIRFNEKIKYYKFLQENLTKNEMKILNVAFLDFIFRSKMYGVKKVFASLILCFKKNLPIFDYRLLNIRSVIDLFKAMKQMKKIDNKYGTK